MNQAERAIKFISNLTLTEDYSGQPFILRNWQEQFIRELLSTNKRKAFLFIPRKNGKTELLAALCLFFLVCGTKGQNLYSAAADQKQAALIFGKCAQMIRADATLSRLLKVLDTTKEIQFRKNESFYKALSSEAYTKHGLNPSVVLCDELHAWKDREFWDVLMSAFGTRKNPLTIVISTAGKFDPTSLIYEQFEYAKKVRDGIVNDPTYLPALYYAEREDDWSDETVWAKANPALGDFRSLEDLRDEYRQAKEIPANEVRFRTLYLNQFVDNVSAFIPLEKWDACNQQPTCEGSCYAGLDLSSTTDLSAFVLLFEDGSVLPYFFAPEEACKVRDRANKTRLDTWIRQGHIFTNTGSVIDYDKIRAKINEVGKRYRIKEIAVDRWNSTQLANQLQGDGFTMIGFGQGYQSMNAPTKELMKLVLEGKLKHGGNPVLRWNIGNLTVETDAAGNVKPTKAKSADKIDGAVSLLMAIARRMESNQSSRYEAGGLRFL